MLHLMLFLYIGGSFGDPAPLIETSLGKITGYHKISYEGRVFSAFEGIPYAQPPVGDLRFEAPKPAESWNGVLNATTIHICTQVKNLFNLPFGNNDSEDCLHLNIYVPKEQPSNNDNFDVIVNIHGGAFMMGAGSMAGPAYIMDRDVVYVSLNYRLGILGFLSTEDTVVPGNNGLKDQQLALRWVQQHIKNFGGNPKSVTLMGLSAGGASVHFHYFSRKSKGLFNRAISQSGTVLMPWAFQEGALQKTNKLAALLNCHNSNMQILINCLKKVRVNELVAKTTDFYGFKQFPIAPFAPVVEAESESSFITKHPYKQLEDGEINDVPWLTWITKDEGIFAIMYIMDSFEKVNKDWGQLSELIFDYEYTAAKTSKNEIAHKIRSFYFQDKEISENTLNSLIKALGDRYFNEGFDTAVRMQTKVSKSPVLAGMYAYSQKSYDLKKMFGLNVEGVSHGADGFLLHDMAFFSTDEVKFCDSDKYIKDLLLDFVTSFAKDGKPKANGINWERTTTNNFNYLSIKGVDDVKMIDNDELAPKHFWEGLNLQENTKATRTHNEL